MPLETPLLWGCPKGHRYPKGTGSALPTTLNLPPVLCFSCLFSGSYPNKSGQLNSHIFDGAPPPFSQVKHLQGLINTRETKLSPLKIFFIFFLEGGAGSNFLILDICRAKFAVDIFGCGHFFFLLSTSGASTWAFQAAVIYLLSKICATLSTFSAAVIVFIVDILGFALDISSRSHFSYCPHFGLRSLKFHRQSKWFLFHVE